jgi:hypothetical protein
LSTYLSHIIEYGANVEAFCVGVLYNKFIIINNKMKKITYLLALLPYFLLISCGEDEMDTTSPQILEGNIIPLPVTGVVCGVFENNIIYAQSGDSIVFGMTFRDEQDLSQYKMVIHDDFDCHGHRGNTEDWAVQKIVDIAGTQHQVQEIVVVPTDVTAGNYHCSFTVLDAAGNSTLPNYYTLSILNSADIIAPTLSMITPASSAVFTNNGDTLSFVGTMDDNAVLSGGRLDLVYFNTSGTQISANMVNLDTTVTTNSYNFMLEYVIPNSLLNGVYEFELRAFDAVGNAAAHEEFDVQVQ